MKTLTTKRPAKYLLILATTAIAALSSCKTNNDPAPSSNAKAAAYVSVTNALEGSAVQDFYLDNAKLSTSAVAYSQNSGYLTTTEGNHTGTFNTATTTTVNANVNASFEAGKYYSIYYTGGANASSNTVVTADDLVAPAAGKAKVRIVQLSSAITTGVDFGVNATSKLVTNLAYKAVSAYQTIDAGTSFSLFATGTATVTLPMTATIEAGKIYTIVISGNTMASLKYTLIVQK